MPMLFVYIAALVAALMSYIPVWVLAGLQGFLWFQSMVAWFLILVGIRGLNSEYDSWRMRVTFLYLASFLVGNIYLFRVGEEYAYLAAAFMPWLLMEFSVGVWRLLLAFDVISVVEKDKDDESSD